MLFGIFKKEDPIEITELKALLTTIETNTDFKSYIESLTKSPNTVDNELAEKGIKYLNTLRDFTNNYNKNPNKDKILDGFKIEGTKNLITKTIPDLLTNGEYKPTILILHDAIGSIVNNNNMSGGGLYKKTDEKVKLRSMTRVVYKTANGKKYIKMDGSWMHLTEAKRKFK
jgi:hypothetical protein